MVSEPRLIEAARNGDRDACNELLLRHRSAAFAFALQLLHHREDALDVTQDALLRFVDSLKRFDTTRKVRPWLFRIVRNRAYDLMRRRKARPAQSLDELIESGAPQPVSAAPHPSQGIEQEELRARIWRGLAALEPPHREILVLRDYQDLSYAQIAETLGIPKGTVMSRLHRARTHLRGLLLELDGTTGTDEVSDA